MAAGSGELLTESYVNLIPTMQGGTHVNGLRQGLLDAMREFCEYRNILPRGVKLSAEDIWDRCAYVLSVKMQDPQFAGQTKERLSSRQCAAFVSGVVKRCLHPVAEPERSGGGAAGGDGDFQRPAPYACGQKSGA
ncbi:topoisomerase IV subunit B [Escherichia coli]|uniref:DNA topoisomerase (ATP-hydrolyzing) n=1 Tax=Escherichia coli TaxID=562 RepID=A0A376MIE3_ECOLX|nr:topoisomerase IV subunit B [Escherichia coli]